MLVICCYMHVGCQFMHPLSKTPLRQLTRAMHTNSMDELSCTSIPIHTLTKAVRHSWAMTKSVHKTCLTTNAKLKLTSKAIC